MHIVNDFVGKMMDIDDKIVNAGIPQPHQHMIQQCMAGQRGQRLGKIVCQWLKSCSKARLMLECLFDIQFSMCHGNSDVELPCKMLGKMFRTID